MASPPPPLNPLNAMAHLNLQFKRFSGRSNENPEVFCRQIKCAKNVYNWSDAQTIFFAGMHMDGRASEWFSNQEIKTWAIFEKAFLERFGIDGNKIMSLLSKRIQGPNESVREYSDALRTLARCSAQKQPDATLLHFFVEGLQPKQREFVLTRRPANFDSAISEAEYYEDYFMKDRKGSAPAVTFDLPKAEEVDTPPATPRAGGRGGRNAAPADPVQELTKQMSRLSLQLAQSVNGGGRTLRPENRTCLNCGQVGHTARDCPHAAQPRGRDLNLLESACDCATYIDDSMEYDSYPETCYYGQEVYAQEKRSREEAAETALPDARRYRPSPMDPETLPDAPNRRPAATRTPIGPVQRPNFPAAPRTTWPAAPTGSSGPPAPRGGTPRTAALRSPGQAPATVMPGYNVVSQLDLTPARLSVTELLKPSPIYRNQMKDYLTQLDQAPAARRRRTNTPENPTPAKVNLHQEMRPNAQPVCMHAQDNPHNNEYDPDWVCHEDLAPPHPHKSSSSSPSPIVARIQCKVNGLPLVAILDSGASTSILSARVMRKLGIFHELQPTDAVFLTASGDPTIPWGVLHNVSVKVGRLSLPMSLTVIDSPTYDFLLGGDWLVSTCCHMMWDKKTVRLRLGPHTYDEVPFDIDGTLKTPSSAHVLQQGKATRKEGSANRPSRRAQRARKPSMQHSQQPQHARQPSTQLNHRQQSQQWRPFNTCGQESESSHGVHDTLYHPTLEVYTVGKEASSSRPTHLQEAQESQSPVRLTCHLRSKAGGGIKVEWLHPKPCRPSLTGGERCSLSRKPPAEDPLTLYHEIYEHDSDDDWETVTAFSEYDRSPRSNGPDSPSSLPLPRLEEEESDSDSTTSTPTYDDGEGSALEELSQSWNRWANLEEVRDTPTTLHRLE